MTTPYWENFKEQRLKSSNMDRFTKYLIEKSMKKNWYESRLVWTGLMMILLGTVWFITDDQDLKELFLVLLGGLVTYLRLDTTTKIIK